MSDEIQNYIKTALDAEISNGWSSDIPQIVSAANNFATNYGLKLKITAVEDTITFSISPTPETKAKLETPPTQTKNKALPAPKKTPADFTQGSTQASSFLGDHLHLRQRQCHLPHPANLQLQI